MMIRAVQHRFGLEGLTIKAALFLGFGLTFGLWIIAGYQFTRRMAEVEREASAISRRYMQAQELLATVRAQILIGSVYVRDALLDPDPASAGCGAKSTSSAPRWSRCSTVTEAGGRPRPGCCCRLGLSPSVSW
jgi:hypothetical protein